MAINCCVSGIPAPFAVSRFHDPDFHQAYGVYRRLPMPSANPNIPSAKTEVKAVSTGDAGYRRKRAIPDVYGINLPFSPRRNSGGGGTPTTGTVKVSNRWSASSRTGELVELT